MEAPEIGCRKRGREDESAGEREAKEIKREFTQAEVDISAATPLTPSSWMAFWDFGDEMGIFEIPPLSPLSPHPSLGYSRLTVV
ncbi:hypothetical protein F511_14047 [Dorcoceras hygrometricum]|uniref:Uncharacterized protein n=1 Tax=Dorcoceras hygrometricum TaxID=472368 RepID=A0A2Z7C579_9LAMI|nr:hypothetical protein F511_14047 [Dorcoceras hygrometricum]